MAGWLVDPILEKLIEACFEYLKDQVRWQTGMKEELQRLRENSPKIQAVIYYASSQADIRDQNPALNEWLWQLRNAIDEADDVIDEFEYIKLKELQAAKNKKKRKVRLIMKSISKRLLKFCKRALKIDPSLKRLAEVVRKLDKVSAGVNTFFLLAKEAKLEQQEQQVQVSVERETASFPKDDQIGRWKEKNYVMQWLRNPSNEPQTQATSRYGNISLLSVVGHGGMGKTTLLQHVYKEMTDEFDSKIWVCVSINFDVKRVITDMLESLKKERPRLKTLDALQESLERELNSKKFLLVLDDIWDEELERSRRKWGDVLAPLSSAEPGSKILVTTRMESVALLIADLINKKNEMLRLEGLEEDECLQLLNRHAFANVEDPGVYRSLTPIAAKIVKKLSGCPLAAKVLGGVLNDRLDEKHWNSVLHTDIRSHNDILSILKLSYLFLPNALRNCYAFCAVFPQNHRFDADDLIRMWISLGFIQPSPIAGESAEDNGRRYFDILVKKSLFDKLRRLSRTYYGLHDLLYEILRSVSAQDCLTITSDEIMPYAIPQTIRHLFVKTKNLDVLRKMTKLKYLRSFNLEYEGLEEDVIAVLAKIFKTSIRIRVLFFYAPELRSPMPEEIRDLIHLRYLHFWKFEITERDRLVHNFYHLQFTEIDTAPQKFINAFARDLKDFRISSSLLANSTKSADSVKLVILSD